MKFKTLIIAAAALFLVAPAYAQGSANVRAEAAKMIRQSGYRCGKAKSVDAHIFGQTANQMAFRVFCDDGQQVANYDLFINKINGHVRVEER